MADTQGDMQIVISDDTVKEALQEYFNAHDVPLFIADATIRNGLFMLDVDFKWKQQSRQPKTLADIKQMFPPMKQNIQPVHPTHDQESINLLQQQLEQASKVDGRMASIYDMLAQLEEQESP